MRGQTEFVMVKRLIHGDIQAIPKYIAEKYPERFELIKEVKKKAPVKKSSPTKVGGKGVTRSKKKEE